MKKIEELIKELSMETGAPVENIQTAIGPWLEAKKLSIADDLAFLDEVKAKFLNKIIVCGSSEYREYYYVTSARLDKRYSMVEFSGVSINIYTGGVSITTPIKRRCYTELDNIKFVDKDDVIALFKQKVDRLNDTLLQTLLR